MNEIGANLGEIYARLSETLVLYGLDLLGAAAILVVGGWLANRSRRWVTRVLERAPRIDPTLKPFLSSLVRYTVLALTVVAVLAQFGVQTTSIIAMLGAAGLAIGLAMQGTLQNIAAGVMLLILQPFRVGDYIDAEGIAGTVNAIGLFATELTTAGGLYVSVPNAQLWNRSIQNYSRNPTRRLDLTFGISYDDDVETAIGVFETMAASDPRVLAEPAPQVVVMALSDSSVDINLRCWANSGDYWATVCDFTKAAKRNLEAAGITLPFPQREVHIRQAAGEQRPV